MIERHIAIELQRNGRVFIKVYTKTVDGALILDGLPLVVDSVEDARELGQKCVEALKLSNVRPLPSRNRRTEPPSAEFLAWSGFKTYAQYARGIQRVSVDASTDETINSLTITPEHNGGARSGFTPISEHRVTIPFVSPEQLGRAVQEAMEKATR